MNFLMWNECCLSILEMYLFEEEKKTKQEFIFDGSNQTVGICQPPVSCVCCLNSIQLGCC